MEFLDIMRFAKKLMAVFAFIRSFKLKMYLLWESEMASSLSSLLKTSIKLLRHSKFHNDTDFFFIIFMVKRLSPFESTSAAKGN